MEVLGLPPKDLIASATRRRLFFDSRGAPRSIHNSKGRKRTPGSKSLSQVLLCPDPHFINFLQRCLEWDPAERMTPEEAAFHEFLLPPYRSHRSCRMSSSSSTGGLNKSSSSQKSSCYNFADISPSGGQQATKTANTNGGGGGAGSGAVGASVANGAGGAVVASITSTTQVSNAAITTTSHKSSSASQPGQHHIMSSSNLTNGTGGSGGVGNHHSHSSAMHQSVHAQSSEHLPDIKLTAGDKYNSLKKMAVRSNITSSVSALDYMQQRHHSLRKYLNNGTLDATKYNMYGMRKYLANESSTVESSNLAKYGFGFRRAHNEHLEGSQGGSGGGGGKYCSGTGSGVIETLPHAQYSTHQNGSSSNVSGGTGGGSHGSQLAASHHNSQSTNNISMSHSQSTGDVSAIFGRA